MRYLGNNTNLVATAALTATNVVPSDTITRTDIAAKQGGGDVTLTGPYTGSADTVIDVKIVGDAGATSFVSAPQFVGAGNGTLTDAAADDALAAQDFTVTLEDLGSDTRAAIATFQGANLVAAATGDSGNAIRINVDRSAIVFAATAFSLQEDLQLGTNDYVGDHWNFGAADLDADGMVPANAPRIAMGGDPQVYRQYRQYKDGAYHYGFSPAPARGVPAGTQVKSVTGTYSITLTNGSDTKTLDTLTSLYDALSAIRDSAAAPVVSVTSAIVNDRLPGGMGVVDLTVFTTSYEYSFTASGSDLAKNADFRVSATSDAPTETLRIKCIAAASVGDEQWSVTGDVSKNLADTFTGMQYARSGYLFAIPEPPNVSTSTIAGNLIIQFKQANPGSDPAPQLFPIKPRLGINAQPGHWEFVYTVKPTFCDPSTATVDGGPNADCLGINEDSGDSMTSLASTLMRMQLLTSALRGYVVGNTAINGYTAGGATKDIKFFNAGAAKQKACLIQLQNATDPIEPPAWAAAHDYAQDVAVTFAGYRYAATTPGTSGGAAPAFPTTVGDTVGDNGITWTCLGKTALGMFDDVFAAWKTDCDNFAALAQSITCDQWIPGISSALNPDSQGHRYWVPTDDNMNGFMYDLIELPPSSGVEITVEPTWPTTLGDTVTQDGYTWQCVSQYWIPSHAYALNDTITFPMPQRSPFAVVIAKVTTAGGNSGTDFPKFPNPGETVVDGGITWTMQGLAVDLQVDITQSDNSFMSRYDAQLDDVIAAAGLTPNFLDAGTEGDGCWQEDTSQSGWFVYDGSTSATKLYAPIQPGIYYHSSEQKLDDKGAPYFISTKEFGFGPAFSCAGSLQPGDRIIIDIADVTGAKVGVGYQVGDEFDVKINHADPLPFTGGQTGDNTLTFSVIGTDPSTGRLADYAVDKNALAPYSNGGLGFQITPGGVPFALGDAFKLSVEKGQFQYRQDGGSWSSTTNIAATVSLLAGLSANFAPGSAPSWKSGDTWTFLAEAANGIDRLRDIVDGRLSWTGSTSIGIAGGSAIAVVALFDHTIPSNAAIRFQGSDDNFATTPVDVPMTWRERDMFAIVAANRAKYRLTIDKGGSIFWLYVAAPDDIVIRTGALELGKLLKRKRMPTKAVRSGLGAQIAHSYLPQSSVDAITDMLEYAGLNDSNRFGIIPNDLESELALVEYDDGTLEVSDDNGTFQPRDVTARRCSLTLNLTPVP